MLLPLHKEFGKTIFWFNNYEAGYTFSMFHIWHYFCRLFTKNKTKHESMPIHIAYIMLFSYFCVACENSEFCYYIFLDNSFDFFAWRPLHVQILHDTWTMKCDIQKTYENKSTHFSFFTLLRSVIRKNVCYTLNV